MGMANSADGDVKIGTPSHTGRNLGVVAALGIAIVGVVIYTMHASKQDDARLVKFDAFRRAYAEKCNVPAYAKEAPDVVRDQYLTTPTIEAAIDAQTTALAAGASCADVAKALHAVDYSVPPAGPAPQ
jgi:hypothetical protein